MPRRGKVNWADLLERAITELGGEAYLKDIYRTLFEFPEAKEKASLAKSKTGKPVDIKAEIRAVVQRDCRFTKGNKRGVWKLSTIDGIPQKENSTEPKGFSLPARYAERSSKILRLMHDQPRKTEMGWAQREISKELKIDINAVNKLVNFMIIEDILYLKGGKGKTYDPFVYAPARDVYKTI